jgi:hypothetical protein
MLIRVTGASTDLEAPEDLKRFKLVVEEGLAGPALAFALGDAGRLEGEHVWVSPDWLYANSGLTDDPEWVAGFTRMVEFAAKHGWVNETGGIRAHIERPPAEQPTP